MSVFDQYKVVTWRDRLAAKLYELGVHRTKKRCAEKWQVLQTSASLANSEKSYRPAMKYLHLQSTTLLRRDYDGWLKTTYLFYIYDLETKTWSVRIERHFTGGYTSHWAKQSDDEFWRTLDRIGMNSLLRAIEFREISQY